MLMPSVTADSVAGTKRALRGRAKFIRGRVGADVRLRAAQSLAGHGAEIEVLGHPPARDAVIAAYYPMGSEIDPLPLVDELRSCGWTVALPCVERPDSPLVFREWDPAAMLDEGPFGTRNPSPAAARLVPRVALVPLLAFDADGYRLGYGGGYYDRTLAALEAAGHSVLSIGLAFSVQEIEMVPHDGWDRRLDLVLTEGGLIVFDGGRRNRHWDGWVS